MQKHWQADRHRRKESRQAGKCVGRKYIGKQRNNKVNTEGMMSVSGKL